MANRNAEKFGGIARKLLGEGQRPVALSEPLKVKHLEKRNDVLTILASSDREEITRYRVPPSDVRIWSDHNRFYDQLDEHKCKDLIEGFKRTGRQEFPAIVRRVEEGSGKFELVCGTRRHWTAAFLGWDLLIEVRDLTDEQAFILQDLENRDREDISDYERALSYKKALGLYFDGNKARMAKRLEIEAANFNRLLDLCDLPIEIVQAYADIRDLKVHHGMVYKKLLANQPEANLLLKRAKALRGTNLGGKQVFARLTKKDTSTSPSNGRKQTHKVAGSDRSHVTIWGNVSKKLSITITNAKGAEEAQLFKTVTDAIKQMMSNSS